MYEILLVVMIFLPGSALQVAMLLLLMAFCLHGTWLSFRIRGYAANLMPFLLGASFLLFYCFVGLTNGNDTENVFRETLAYTAFLAGTFFLLAGYRFTAHARTAILIGFSVYLLMKLCLFSILALGLISPLEFYLQVKTYVPSAVVSSFMGSQTPRVVFSNDFLLPVFLFWLSGMYYLQLIKQKIFAMLFSLAIIVIALSLSRYLYLLAGLAVLASSYLFFRGKSVFLYATAIVGAVVLLQFVIQWVGYDDLINARFSGAGARSNEIKFEQLALLDEFAESPLLGKGFGVDLGLSGRTLRNAFQSEVQWLGLMVKTGTLGIFIGCAFILYIARRLLAAKRGLSNKLQFLTLLMFLAWMLAGWTNPVLFLVSSCVNYLMLYSVIHENNRAGSERAQLRSASIEIENINNPQANSSGLSSGRSPNPGVRRRARKAK